MPRSASSSRPYHHANLRQTLLDAAVALIGEVGPRAFTLREVARRAGVSHDNAPYRHFAGRDELLAIVAAEGFDRLTLSMRRTPWRPQGRPASGLSSADVATWSLRCAGRSTSW